MYDPDWWHLAAIAFAVLMPLWPLYRLGILLWRMIALDKHVPPEVADPMHRRDLPLLLGILERVLYARSWLAVQPAFIGIWLVLKVAGGWKAWAGNQPVTWNDGGAEKSAEITGRHMFNVFLINSAVSLIAALGAAAAAERLTGNSWQEAVALALAATLLVCGVWIWAECRWKSIRPKSSLAA